MKKDDNNDQLANWIFSGDMEKVKAAIQLKVNLNELYSNGMTPLLLAVEGDQPKILELLLKNGANPNQKSGKSGTTALHWAVGYAYDGMTQNNRNIPYPEPLECIRILLQYGADKSLKDNDGQTPLEYRTTEDIRNEFKGK